MTEYEKPRILSVTAQHVAELERENAKLRELCRDMFAHESTDCERCAYGERCRVQETTCYTAGIIIRKRARDLGVDV